MASLGKPSALVRPTLDTKFHIDYDWWERSNDDLRIYLLSHLPSERRSQLSQASEGEVVDYVDTDTAEVFQFDALQLALQEAAKDPEFITPQTATVDGIFRIFLRNKNQPLTSRELGDQLGKSPDTILRTISGRQIYKGIRPIAK